MLGVHLRLDIVCSIEIGLCDAILLTILRSIVNMIGA